MPVDILDRHRRQVVPLANPGAEPRHHHRVRTQVVEEVRVGRHLLHTQHAREHLGERLSNRLGGRLGGRSRGGGDDSFRGGCQCAGQVADRRVPVDSLIDTDGRSSRLRTRAQNRAITIESAPRSSKKCASTGTCSTPRTPANTSANATATGAGAGTAVGTATGSGVAGSVGATTTGTADVTGDQHGRRNDHRNPDVTGETGSVGAAFTCWAVAGLGRATVRASTGFATA